MFAIAMNWHSSWWWCTILLVLLLCHNVSIISAAAAAAAEEEQQQQRQQRRVLLHMDTKEIVPRGRRGEGAAVSMPVMSIGTGGVENSTNNTYEIVSNWLQLGGTAIDTALNYYNQDQVRQAIKDNAVLRSSVFITTKIPDCNVSNVRANFMQDLKLLDTTYVDLMLIHGPRRGNCTEAWRLLEEFYHLNQTRAIGVSNFRPKDLKPIVLHANIVPHVNQIKLNLLIKDVETINYSTRHGIVIEAYSPLGGRDGRDIIHHPVVQRIAHEYNVTTYQIALKWILQHGWILTFQSSSQKHQAVDADVFQFTLKDKDMTDLDAMSKGDDSPVMLTQ